jgi:hypothetical protein
MKALINTADLGTVEIEVDLNAGHVSESINKHCRSWNSRN